MGYQEFWQTYREEVTERFPLVVERLKQMETEETVAHCWSKYFQQTAVFLGKLCRLEEEYYKGAWAQKSMEELQAENHMLYEELLLMRQNSWGRNTGKCSVCFMQTCVP